MNKHLHKILAVVTVSTALSACVGPSERSMKIAPDNSLTADVASTLTLDLPSGDVTVTPSSDQKLHAKAVFYCSEGNDRCREKSEAATIQIQSDADSSTLIFTPSSSYSTRTADIHIDVAVPAVDQLVIEMPAGALNVKSPTACLDLKLGAGDASVRAPEASAASVDLDTGLGESSLRTSAGSADETRPLLVGSEVVWSGSGECHLKGRVRAGSLSVRLD